MTIDDDKLKKLDKVSVNRSMTLRAAFEKMDSDVVRLLCVREAERYYGIISAGDIQRAIIANRSLDTTVGDSLRADLTVARSSWSFPDTKNLMLKFRTEFMPVLDDAGVLVDVYFWDDVFPTKKPAFGQIDLPVVMMAGGKGTRLKPFTNILPKPLFPLGEKTIAETIMDKFHEVGSRRFWFSVNYRHEMIKTYFDLLENPYDIKYFQEDQPLGTAGSLTLLKGVIDETFFVSNCDIVIDADYSEIVDYHREQKNEITMVTSLKHVQIPYGTVETGEGGQVQSLVEKPEFTFMINAGFYVLEPHLLDQIPEGEFYHITELIDKVRSRNGRVGAYPVSEKSWCDIGEWGEYRETLAHFGP